MKKLLFFLSLIFVFFSSSSFALGAGYLTLTPATGSVAVGQTVKISLNIDTGTSSVTGVDAIINFNPNYLSVSQVAWGSVFGTQTINPTIDNVAGKIALHPGATSPAYSFTGQGIVAEITFSGKAAGTSPVTFTCTAATTQGDTNIWSGGEDIINCAQNTGGSYTITASSGGGTTQPTSTPTPTSGGGSSTGGTETTAAPSPSQLPESGVTEWTFLIGALGVFFLLGGTKLLLSKKE